MNPRHELASKVLSDFYLEPDERFGRYLLCLSTKDDYALTPYFYRSLETATELIQTLEGIYQGGSFYVDRIVDLDLGLDLPHTAVVTATVTLSPGTPLTFEPEEEAD